MRDERRFGIIHTVNRERYKMRALQWIVIACISSVFLGCASSAVIITGAVRDPIDVNEVKIVSTIPANAEELAIIRASSGAGFTVQQSYDYAVKELKVRAADIGGNVVVIESVGTHTDGYTYGHGFMTANESEYLAGKVYYVPGADKEK